LDFNPCMKHKVIRKTVRGFAETELGPIAHEIDRDARFPWEVIEKMKPLNFFGLQVPKDYGGADVDSISYAISIEELSRVCAAIGLCVTVHNSVGTYPIVQFGTKKTEKAFSAGTGKRRTDRRFLSYRGKRWLRCRGRRNQCGPGRK